MNKATTKNYITSLLVIAFAFSTYAADTLTTSQILRDNGDTLISSRGRFELGFFSPNSSENRYVGIWYKNIAERTVVWVANHEHPLTDTSGTLRVMESGAIALLDANDTTIWSTNASRSVQTPVARLLDSGNLVVKDANDDNNDDGDDDDNRVWQSFDYPTDTLIAGMKLGRNFVTGKEVYITSPKSISDPAFGDYTFHLDPTGYPQDETKMGDVVTYKSGPWNGMSFSGTPMLQKNRFFTYDVGVNEKEAYFHFELINDSVVIRLTMSESGIAERWIWVEGKGEWKSYSAVPIDYCDGYNGCGPYGSCNIKNSPSCGCLNKFQPKDPKGQETGDWSSGCVRATPLDCIKGDGFVKYHGIKLPDTNNSWHNKSMTLEECKQACSKNCSCMAYTSLDISRGRNGCLLWFGDLVNIREITPGQEIYIRMARSELGSGGRKQEILTVALSLMVVIGVVLICLVLYSRKRSKADHELPETDRSRLNREDDHREEGCPNKDLELPLFDFATLLKATDGFSLSNKLGEGGFGPVYKARLEDGREVAVKRLSRTSLQGVDEFKNEMICIAELQHRNLVKLLGCCIQREEKMLVYEYMTNRSLDLILFDPVNSLLLDWTKRFNIINGIARGLMYLHQDSRLRVIHRDLKASNILLDSSMNPKISDFGLARTFGGDETGANTSRVIGTYGYMSPEYAAEGLFSVKSDVFSFGVLVLEIVSGKRNRGFYHRDHRVNLPGHAWMLYKEEKLPEFVDPCLKNSCDMSEVGRVIQIGLLCVQELPQDRPSMSAVVLMLSNGGALSEAKQPGFFTGKSLLKSETSVSSNASTATNTMTMSLPEGR